MPAIFISHSYCKGRGNISPDSSRLWAGGVNSFTVRPVFSLAEANKLSEGPPERFNGSPERSSIASNPFNGGLECSSVRLNGVGWAKMPIFALSEGFERVSNSRGATRKAVAGAT